MKNTFSFGLSTTTQPSVAAPQIQIGQNGGHVTINTTPIDQMANLQPGTISPINYGDFSPLITNFHTPQNFHHNNFQLPLPDPTGFTTTPALPMAFHTPHYQIPASAIHMAVGQNQMQTPGTPGSVEYPVSFILTPYDPTANQMETPNVPLPLSFTAENLNNHQGEQSSEHENPAKKARTDSDDSFGSTTPESNDSLSPFFNLAFMERI